TPSATASPIHSLQSTSCSPPSRPEPSAGSSDRQCCATSRAEPAASSSANGPPQSLTNSRGEGKNIGLLEGAREVGSGRERIGGAGEQDDHPIPGDRGG